jgi:hypothetical protein
MIRLVLPDGAVKLTPALQSQVPVGITKVFVVEVTVAQAFFTSVRLQLLAVTVCAMAERGRKCSGRKAPINKKRAISVLILPRLIHSLLRCLC